MLLSFRGRKTGKSYLQPVSYVSDGDTLLTPGGGKWKLNLREDEPVRVYLRGRYVLARPEFIRGVDDVGRLLLPAVGDARTPARRISPSAVIQGAPVVTPFSTVGVRHWS